MEFIALNFKTNITFNMHFLLVCLQVKEFLSRFANIPDLLELDHLTVSGDVTFGKNVSIKVINVQFQSHFLLARC